MLAHSGFGSRKEVKVLIRQGLVKINGHVIRRVNHIVFPRSDSVYVDNMKVDYKEHHYIMLNKPSGVITSTKDRFSTTVIDILGDGLKGLGLFPIGRLDKDTEGLLILTTDGKLAHQLLSPRNYVPKRYLATVDGIITSSDIERFKHGIPLDEDFITLSSKLEIISPNSVYITIYEGKFHQVKRMLKYIGRKTLYLKRVQMGKLKLDENLAPGEARELTDNEIALLKSSVK